MRRILAGVVLAVMLTGCDSENASDETEPQAEKASEVEKAIEADQASEADKAAEAVKAAQVDRAAEAVKAAEAKKVFEEAAAAYKSGDYATALRLLRPIAERGVFPAQMMIGAIYSQGQGVQQDYREALKWYRLAADGGMAEAQIMVGNFYLQGNGVFPDYAEAVKWFRYAAEQGDAKAQNNLGLMFASGNGVPKDYVRALMWFSLAASPSPTSDQPADPNAIKNRDRAASLMTPEQVAEAQRLAREWKPNQTPQIGRGPIEMFQPAVPSLQPPEMQR